MFHSRFDCLSFWDLLLWNYRYGVSRIPQDYGRVCQYEEQDDPDNENYPRKGIFPARCVHADHPVFVRPSIAYAPRTIDGMTM